MGLGLLEKVCIWLIYLGWVACAGNLRCKVLHVFSVWRLVSCVCMLHIDTYVNRTGRVPTLKYTFTEQAQSAFRTPGDGAGFMAMACFFQPHKAAALGTNTDARELSGNPSPWVQVSQTCPSQQNQLNYCLLLGLRRVCALPPGRASGSVKLSWPSYKFHSPPW